MLLQGILGTINSGKSALVHRYLTGSYMQEESPEGMNFQIITRVDYNKNHFFVAADISRQSFIRFSFQFSCICHFVFLRDLCFTCLQSIFSSPWCLWIVGWLKILKAFNSGSSCFHSCLLHCYVHFGTCCQHRPVQPSLIVNFIVRRCVDVNNLVRNT